MKKYLMALAIAAAIPVTAQATCGSGTHNSANCASASATGGAGGNANAAGGNASITDNSRTTNTNTQDQAQGQHQGQLQGQLQGQGQGQSQNANNQGNSQNVTIENNVPKQAPAGPGIASSPSATCRIAIGASIGVVGFSGGGFGSVEDENCVRNEKVRMLKEVLGRTDAAKALACKDKDMAEAMGDCPKPKTAEAAPAVKTAEVPAAKVTETPALKVAETRTTPVSLGNCPAGQEIDPILAARGVKACYVK